MTELDQFVLTVDSQCSRAVIQPGSEFIVVKERIWVCDCDAQITVHQIIVHKIVVSIVHTEIIGSVMPPYQTSFNTIG